MPWQPASTHLAVLLPTLHMLPVIAVTAIGRGKHDRSAIVLWAWLTGAMLGSGRLAVHYIRLRRQLRPVSPTLQRELALAATLDARTMRRLRLHPDRPTVLWGPRALLLLPPDFVECFDAYERPLVLQHERVHLHRRDPLWRLLAELAVAVLWFHPLAWLALPCFRLDQELACEECVLRDTP